MEIEWRWVRTLSGLEVPSGLLGEFARRAEPIDAFRSEREATRVDASGDATTAEEREWEAVLGDGLGCGAESG